VRETGEGRESGLGDERRPFPAVRAHPAVPLMNGEVRGLVTEDLGELLGREVEHGGAQLDDRFLDAAAPERRPEPWVLDERRRPERGRAPGLGPRAEQVPSESFVLLPSAAHVRIARRSRA
jgi:hypothetical protein